jgi:hypothetical protein
MLRSRYPAASRLVPSCSSPFRTFLRHTCNMAGPVAVGRRGSQDPAGSKIVGARVRAHLAALLPGRRKPTKRERVLTCGLSRHARRRRRRRFSGVSLMPGGNMLAPGGGVVTARRTPWGTERDWAARMERASVSRSCWGERRCPAARWQPEPRAAGSRRDPRRAAWPSR